MTLEKLWSSWLQRLQVVSEKYKYVFNERNRCLLTPPLIMGKRTAVAAFGRVGSLNAKRVRKNRFTSSRRVRRVRRTTKTLHRRRRPVKKQEFSGGFTKCYKSQWRRPRRSVRGRIFAKRVRNVILNDIPRQTEIRDYSWTMDDIPDGTSQTSVPHYFQFALDYIGDETSNGALTAGQLNAAYNYEVQPLLRKSNGVRNAQPVLLANYDAPTVSNAASVGLVPGNVTGGNVKFRKLYSSMKLTLKNPRSMALVVELYTVRPVRSMPHNTDVDNSYKWLPSPLTAFYRGFAAVPSDGQIASLNVSGFSAHATNELGTQLMDSPMFRDSYKITKKCRLYIPAGGLLEKSLIHKYSRMYSTEYLNRYALDRATEYLVGKCYYEPMVGASGQGCAPVAPTTDVAPMLIGYAQYRMTVKAIEEAARVERQNYQAVTIPVSQSVVGNAVMTHREL